MSQNSIIDASASRTTYANCKSSSTAENPYSNESIHFHADFFSLQEKSFYPITGVRTTVTPLS